MKKWNMEKIKYSKCPNCKKYGLPSFFRLSRTSTTKVSCKYCEKVYRINIFIGVFIRAAMVIFACFLGHYNVLPDPLIIVVAGFLLLILGYFAPMQEVDD